jgi:hypothetical protein
MTEPLLFSHRDLPFDRLDRLRDYLDRMLQLARPSMVAYHHETSGGFVHYIGSRERRPQGDSEQFSRASTATCIAFLVDYGGWPRPDQASAAPWATRQQDLADKIVTGPWRSAGLPEDNPFTVSFLLEALHDLIRVGAALNPEQQETVDSKLALLSAHVLTDDPSLLQERGGVSIPTVEEKHPLYPPTAFLTQKVVRVLKLWGQLDQEVRSAVEHWAWRRLHEESVLLSAERPDADVFEVAYSCLIVSGVQPLEAMTPRQRAVLRFAIDQVFAKQDTRGVWPRSRPLFLYPGLGNAYAYEYELLVQMLLDQQLASLMLTKLPQLEKSALVLDEAKIPLSRSDSDDGDAVRGAVGWASGHLTEPGSAESWSTASCFHFCHRLQRLLAEAIRQAVFEEVGASYTVPPRLANPDSAFSGFLDSPILVPGSTAPQSLESTLRMNFLEPVAADAFRIDRGEGFSSGTPMSAIFYGPPGTSKTGLAKIISRYLGWPLLKLDPSHLTRDGLDRLHAEANRLFVMLEASEQIVVLLDEFDELVRERDEAGSEVMSRFITTAMLPKLTALAERRRLIFLLATNHIERFDAAISRQGRFDMIVPVMPPLVEEKLRYWPDVAARLEEAGLDPLADPLCQRLEDLTFLEFRDLVPLLMQETNPQQLQRLVEVEHGRSTMNRKTVDGQTLKERIAGQAERIRLPRVAVTT